MELVDIDKIIPYDRNPRRINQKAVDADEHFVVLSGHTRLKAYRSLGIKEVPVVQHMDMTETQKRTYRIAANKTAEYSDWDDQLLEAELKDIDLEIQQMSESTGLSEKELRAIIAEPERAELDAPAPRETNVKRGEIYQLGRHRLMCGDSTSAEDVNALMGGAVADMVFSDPPYGVSIGDKNKMKSTMRKGNGIEENIEGDTLDSVALGELLTKAFANIYAVLNDKAAVYITFPISGDLGRMIQDVMKDAGLAIRHVLIWVKNRQTFSAGRLDYDYQHEPILFTWKKTHKKIMAGKHTTSTWFIDCPQKSELHPTMKPVEIPENAMLNSSDIGDVIIDLFGGAGSTLIAAEKTDRKAYLMEIDPVYAQVIIDRYIQFTGRSDVKKIDTSASKK